MNEDLDDLDDLEKDGDGVGITTLRVLIAELRALRPVGAHNQQLIEQLADLVKENEKLRAVRDAAEEVKFRARRCLAISLDAPRGEWVHRLGELSSAINNAEQITRAKGVGSK